jgi:hypothetical protein
MLITKFNRMIRNKWLWGGFAVVISIMFVGTFSPAKGGCYADKKNPHGSGQLYGETVSAEEFNMARFFELGMRSNANLNPEAAEHLRIRTWKRLAALRTADRMGITVSDDQVGETICRDSNFAVSGVFSKEKYRGFVENQLRVSVSSFESYVRQELTLRKLAGVLEATIWTSPTELSQKLENLTDSLTVEYTTLNLSNTVGQIKVSDDEVKEFFEANKEFFQIPEKVNVKYVAFPISNYLANAEIKDDDVREYYDNHIEDYSTPVTNDIAGTNDIAEHMPLEEVKDGITEILRHDFAVLKAKDAATELVMALTPSDRDQKAPSFEAVAAASNLTVSTSVFFAMKEKVPGLSVDRSFNKAAFDLEPDDPNRSFSDAIVGSNAIYVIAANQKAEARTPDLEEVRNVAEPLARRASEKKLFLQKVTQVRDSIKKALESGKTFTKAAEEAHLKVTTTKPFTIYETGMAETNDIEHYEEFLPKITSLKKGEISEPVEIKGGALLAYIAERTPGDLMAVETLRPQLVATLDRYRAEILFEDWCNFALAKAGFTNLVSETAEKQTSDETPAGPDIPPEL